MPFALDEGPDRLVFVKLCRFERLILCSADDAPSMSPIPGSEFIVFNNGSSNARLFLVGFVGALVCASRANEFYLSERKRVPSQAASV